MRKYVDFRGRARRREFWMFTLFNTLVCGLLFVGGCVAAGLLVFRYAEGEDVMVDVPAAAWVLCGFVLLFYIWMLATFLPGLAVRVRRLHDIGLSGKWLLGYYALYTVCLHWLWTSILRVAGSGAVEGMSELQTGVAFWIVMRPTALALAVLSATGIAAMCIGSERGPNRYGSDPTAVAVAENKCLLKKDSL